MTAASEQLLTEEWVRTLLKQWQYQRYGESRDENDGGPRASELDATIALAHAWLSTHQSESPSRRGEAVLERLARFALWAIHLHRENECADIDGCSIQEKLVESGILHEKTVTESCGDHCVCMELGEQDEWQCYFLSDEVVAIDASLNTSPHAPSPVSEDEGGRTL